MSTTPLILTFFTSYDRDRDQLTLLAQDAKSGAFMALPSTLEAVSSPVYGSSATYETQRFTATISADVLDAHDGYVVAFQHSPANAGAEAPPRFSIWTHAELADEGDEIIDVALLQSDGHRFLSEVRELGATIHFQIKCDDGTSSSLGYTIALAEAKESSPPPVLRPPDRPKDASGGENPLANPAITSDHEPWVDPGSASARPQGGRAPASALTQEVEALAGTGPAPQERGVVINITITLDRYGSATVSTSN